LVRKGVEGSLGGPLANFKAAGVPWLKGSVEVPSSYYMLGVVEELKF
jgi:hypothetical protein